MAAARAAAERSASMRCEASPAHHLHDLGPGGANARPGTPTALGPASPAPSCRGRGFARRRSIAGSRGHGPRCPQHGGRPRRASARRAPGHPGRLEPPPAMPGEDPAATSSTVAPERRGCGSALHGRVSVHRSRRTPHTSSHCSPRRSTCRAAGDPRPPSFPSPSSPPAHPVCPSSPATSSSGCPPQPGPSGEERLSRYVAGEALRRRLGRRLSAFLSRFTGMGCDALLWPLGPGARNPSYASITA